MASHGIKDQVAIIGMGCTPFKEHWDRSADDLMVEAVQDTLASAGVAKDDIDAWWLGTAQSGMSGVTLAAPGAISVRIVSGIASSSASSAWSIARSASIWRAYETGRVACWPSPRTALLYSMPPIALDVPFSAKRCMK